MSGWDLGSYALAGLCLAGAFFCVGYCVGRFTGRRFDRHGEWLERTFPRPRLVRSGDEHEEAAVG